MEADDYIQYRLEDQFNWYRRKAKIYDRDYQILQTYVYFFGGLGTLLAAIGFQNWVAVSTALATSLAGYLEYKRVEATLVGYNQARRCPLRYSGLVVFPQCRRSRETRQL